MNYGNFDSNTKKQKYYIFFLSVVFGVTLQSANTEH